MKHTPGPWIATSYKYFIRSNSEDVVIAEIYQSDYIEGRPSFKCGQANANLIAAAPEMLAALEIALGYIKSGWETPRGDYGGASGHVKLIELIIAKARGEQ